MELLGHVSEVLGLSARVVVTTLCGAGLARGGGGPVLRIVRLPDLGNLIAILLTQSKAENVFLNLSIQLTCNVNP